MQCLVCVGNQVPKMIKGACKGDEYCNGDTCFSPTVFNPNEKEYLTCVCKPGFKRDANGNCVDSCKPVCKDPLEVHDYVTDDCKKEEHCDPDSCASIMPVDPTWTCVCPHGTYRHEGKCVKECPKDPEPCGANGKMTTGLFVRLVHENQQLKSADVFRYNNWNHSLTLCL